VRELAEEEERVDVRNPGPRVFAERDRECKRPLAWLLNVDLGMRRMVDEVSRDRWISAFFAIGNVLEESIRLYLEAIHALAKRVALSWC